jgi:hypothetical protein
MIFDGIIAVGEVLVEIDEKSDKMERNLCGGKTLDERTDELERKYLKGKTIYEKIYGNKM